MVIIFYDSEKEQVYICTEREKMKTISINDPDILTHVPNDDVLYVQNAHFITKKQFGEWLEGDDELLSDEPHRFTGFMEEPTSYEPGSSGYQSVPVEKMHESASKYKHSKFIHPVHNGAILISDVHTEKYPNGVELVGKFHFIPLEDIGGEDILEGSAIFRSLLAKGKIEVVGYDYVKKHYNKKKMVSAADAELEKILIKSSTHGSAEAVAAAGGMGGGGGGAISASDPIEIFVESSGF